MAGFDTIVEGKEVDPPVSTRGNASLCQDSSMAKLLDKYMSDANGSSLSMEATVVLLVTIEHIVLIKD